MLLSTTTDLMSKHFGLEKTVDMLSETGFDALDFSAFCEEYYTEIHKKEFYIEIRKRAEEKKVIFNQSHAPFISFGGREEEKCAANFERVVGAMRNASYLGVKNIVVHPYQYLKYSEEGNPERLFEYNMKFYKSLIPYCEEFGIRVALENVWQYQKPGWNKIGPSVCGRPEEFISYLDELNNECFTGCLDVGHATLVCEDVAEFIEKLGNKRLGALHIHDVDGIEDLHTLPFFGIIDWDKVTRALAKIDYKGDFTFEADNFYKGKPLEMYPECAEFMVKTGRFLINKIKE